MRHSMKKHGITLALFAAVTTALTAVVYQLTKPTISYQAALQQQALLDQVVPATNYDNNMQHECFLVSDPALGNSNLQRLYLARKQGVPVAAALETTAPDGYSGAIRLLVGADFDGQVLGVRVIEHHETPGLGDKIELRLSSWITLFTDKKIDGPDDKRWAVKKDGGIFDQFTGATITPRAVVNAVRRTALYIKTVPSKLDTLPACGANQ